MRPELTWKPPAPLHRRILPVPAVTFARSLAGPFQPTRGQGRSGGSVAVRIGGTGALLRPRLAVLLIQDGRCR